MAALAAPILPGKTDDWIAWAKEIEARSDDFADHNRRHGLTHHRAWLQQNPDGSAMAVVVHEGPGADGFLESVAGSDHPFDVWMKEHITAIHGMEFATGHMPPPNPQMIDGTA